MLVPKMRAFLPLSLLTLVLLTSCECVKSPADLRVPGYIDRLATVAQTAAQAQAGENTDVSFHDYAEEMGSLLALHPSVVRTAQAQAGENTDVSFHDYAEEMGSLLALHPSVVRSAVLETVGRLSDSGGNVPTRLQATGDSLAAYNVSQLCLNHTLAILMAMLERQPWATQMLDAMGKPSPGLLVGNLNWPGAYQECLNVRANTSVISQPQFAGQYCALQSVVAQVAGTPTVLSLGACVPDSCSALDLTIMINEVLSTFNSSLAGKAFAQCASEETTWDGRAVVALIICSVVLAFLVLGTVLDIMFVKIPLWRFQENAFSLNSQESPTEENSPLLPKSDPSANSPEPAAWMKPLLAFSVYTNGSKLLSTQKAAGSLDCIHGVRFLSMTWVVFGHALMFPLFQAANAGPYLQEVLKRWTFQAILNATVSVDSFFTLSGLLVAYLTLKEMKKKSGKINWFMFYFHRFWRLTPVYMMVIMIYTCLSPYWGKGPYWSQMMSNPDRVNCETSWWTNLLYINNVVRVKEMCLGQSWYLSNDMQFYILSPLIVVPFYFSPVLGAVSSAVFLLVTAIVPGVLTMRDHIPVGFLPNQLEGNVTMNMMDYFSVFYVKPYNRMGAYVVGMLAGYFLYHTNCKLRINKWVNLSIWAVATASALAVVYGPYESYNGHPLTLSVSAFYNATSRQVWGACVAWVIVACVTGNGGFVNTILSWSALVPLSRLTYCIYLLHLMLISVYCSNLNTVFYANDLNIVIFFLGILVVSYMAAFVTSLAFEAPMMALEKVLFGRGKKQEK